ncbi:non-homologous end joining protein Ku [Segnochrobactrum spirostomi]|uniref:Non-homologous end joining protein Ku n=1 Tax=Segnochrobactrum spirostomi TaxID=2608987 RepID=A0A6A7Y1U8_9HYPH|nr:Ku protein [Segnochrobactrum spirostomi]MQT11839.1 Ku protein [Segnochrobactrum spirostomi]
MAPRANWKGYLKVAELTCPVALYTAASTAERLALHTLNRETGHRVLRDYVDRESGDTVPKDDQVKGYEVAADDYVVLEPDEVAAAVPEADKTLAVEAFIRCRDVDDVYFDRPYYLAPSGRVAEEAFTLIREGMRAAKVAALARTVLFRRMRTILIRPHDTGLVGTTLRFDYEVRAAAEVFDDIGDLRIEGEMLDLAKHIIGTKKGQFDPKAYDDRYEAALAELVRAKIEGRPIEKPAARPAAKVVDLMEALRQSAGMSPPAAPKAKATRAGRGTKAKAAAEKPPATARRRKAS